MRKNFMLLALLGLLVGCGGFPLKGGRHLIQSATLKSSLVQPQNPKDESTQVYDRVIEDEIPVKPGDKVDGIEVKEATVIRRKTTEHVAAKVGAAQKDTAREAAAKLASLRPVVWVGILLFILGVASAVYPPFRALVGSVTTSAFAALAGLALIVLPVVIVGHETLILVLGVCSVAGWFFVHRHGELRGRVNSLTGK